MAGGLAALGLAATAHGGVEEEGEVGGDGGYPHEDKHADANVGLDVELVLGGGGDLEGDADGGGNNGSDGDEDGGDAAEDGEGEGEPSGADGQRGGEHEEEVEEDAGEEEAEHEALADAEESEDGEDLGGQGDLGAGQQLAHEDLDGVEPVERLGFRAVRDAFIVVALAKVPQAYLIKVVQAEAPGDGVEEVRVGDGDGDDLGDVEPEEPGVADDGGVLDVADEDEDQEGDGEEVEKGGDEGGVAAGDGSGHGGRGRRAGARTGVRQQ